MGTPALDLTGHTYGRLLVLSRHPERTKAGKIQWICRCACGTVTVVRRNNLRSGNTASCGCLFRGATAGRATHGHRVAGKSTPEYRAWRSMKTRCLVPTSRSYPGYGGRGIKVCQRWVESFDAFLADVGSRPSADLSLDRIDNDGDYEPGNVRWATRSQQQRNKRRSNSKDRSS